MQSKLHRISLGAVALSALVTFCPFDARPAAAPGAGLRVGTFDSRGLAVAYTRSAAFSEYLETQRAHIRKAMQVAEKQGDADLHKALAALGPAMQDRVHRQGFSTAPVDNILARIEDRLPALAKQAGVDLIVCKWDVTWQADGAETIDVTELLTREFAPDARTAKVIHELCKKPPVPAEKLKRH